MILKTDKFKHYIDNFNENDEESVVQYIDNKSAWTWLTDNMPVFECPDKMIEETYYFRWWVYRKHLKKTPDGFIITEFLPEVPWAGKYNSINGSAFHHIYEGRWMRNKVKYINDYILFWFRKGGSLRSYSSWFADTIWNYCMINGDFSLAVDLLPDLVNNYCEWEKSNLNKSGLFWSHDDRDAMEFSISGSGLRPTLNSYMYGDAMAISKIARLAGCSDLEEEFFSKSMKLKRLIQDRLWDENTDFFKVVPLNSSNGEVTDWDFKTIDPDHNVREQIGFIPWYFNMPDSGYEVAWKQLINSEGFYAPFGPTTAEKRHPRFMFKHQDQECLWNGPSWPYATSQTLTAMANLLNNYEQNIVNKIDYFELFKIYSKCQYRTETNGEKVSWIDENIDPHTGEWLARSILEKWGWPMSKGGQERGKDYNHSTYCDLIITGLVGLKPRFDGTIEVNPLVPDEKWDYFCLDYLQYHNKTITILYDRTGERYDVGRGFKIFVDGTEVASSERVERKTVL